MAQHRGGHPTHHARDAADPGAEVDPGGPVDWEQPPAPAPLWRTRILLPAVLVLAVVVGAWWAVGWLTSSGPGRGNTVLDPVPVVSSGPSSSSSSSAGAADPLQGTDSVAGADAGDGADEVIVHVAGEVRTPGIVTLPGGSRVVDAVQAAGGPTVQAHLDLVNLAAPVTDGAQILIPGPDGMPATAPGSTDNGAQAGPAAGTGTVDVNTAGPAELETLPGIGPALAQRIIEHREQVGPYGSLEDLDAVSGIGPALMARLEGQVSW